MGWDNGILFWDRKEPGSLFLQHCSCQLLPQRIYKGFLPAQPQQHHCYDMELHKSSHLELVTLITTCSLESRLAPLTPAHLWLQSTACSSSNPYMSKGWTGAAVCLSPGCVQPPALGTN